MSEPAKDLITNLLTVDSRMRYTAADVLTHPWMQMPCSSSDSDNEDSTGTVDMSVTLMMITELMMMMMTIVVML